MVFFADKNEETFFEETFDMSNFPLPSAPVDRQTDTQTDR